MENFNMLLANAAFVDEHFNKKREAIDALDKNPEKLKKIVNAKLEQLFDNVRIFRI